MQTDSMESQWDPSVCVVAISNDETLLRPIHKMVVLFLAEMSWAASVNG